jgi:hypothetical protein
MYIKLVKIVPHMFDQVGLKVQKYQSKSQICIHLNNNCETSQCIVGDRWSNDRSDSVIVSIVTVVYLVIDDHVV